MPLFMISVIFIVGAGAVVFPLWWLFASGFSGKTRVLGVIIVLGLIGGFLAIVRDIEMVPFHGTGLHPRFTFIWHTNHEDTVEANLAMQHQLKDALPPIDFTEKANDFPRYRGRHTDGVVTGLVLDPDWTNHPPKLLWKQPCGGGYSGFAVVGNVAVTLEQRKGGKEAIACYDRATGRQHWAYDNLAYYWDKMRIGDGPRSTPLIDQGEIFTVGATGDLLCLEGKTGTKKWGVNILDDNQAKNIKWGLTGSPVLIDNLIIVNPGIDEDKPVSHSLAAYDRATGNKIWSANQRKAGYSSPQQAIFQGMKQILLFDGEGLAGYDPKDGRELWAYRWITEYDMNSIQPVVLGEDRVLISSEVINGSALLRINKEGELWKAEVVWKKPKTLGARFANPVTNGQHIFGLHNQRGTLVCLDAATGDRLWTGPDFGPGQLLLCGKHLIIQDGGTGELCLADADPRVYNERGRLALFHEKTWNTHALAGQHLFLRNEKEMACVYLPTLAE